MAAINSVTTPSFACERLNLLASIPTSSCEWCQKVKKKKRKKKRWSTHGWGRNDFVMCGFFFFFFFLTTWPSIVTPAGLCNRSTTTKKTTRPVAQSSGNLFYFFQMKRVRTYLLVCLLQSNPPPPGCCPGWVVSLHFFSLNQPRLIAQVIYSVSGSVICLRAPLNKERN